jgi:hypothetical protein
MVEVLQRSVVVRQGVLQTTRDELVRGSELSFGVCGGNERSGLAVAVAAAANATRLQSFVSDASSARMQLEQSRDEDHAEHDRLSEFLFAATRGVKIQQLQRETTGRRPWTRLKGAHHEEKAGGQ